MHEASRAPDVAMVPTGFLYLRTALLSLTIALPCYSQNVIQAGGPNGQVRTIGADEAVLESQEVRKELMCTVEPIKAMLGFDLRFHTGYDVTVPLKDIAGMENQLTMIYRVTYEKDKDHPVYFSHRISVPKIEEDAKGEAYLEGTFDVGEGNYHIDFLMRDRSERVCTFYWDTKAELAIKDKDVALHILPGAIEGSDREPFREEPPITRGGKGTPLSVKVMVNFAPQKARSATLQPLDTNALISILRNISRETRIGKFTVVAFNMQEQRVLYRQENTEQINFPALGDSLKSLNLGTVNLKLLEDKHGNTEFLSRLITEEIANSKADALIFAGPKVMLDEGVPQESLKALESNSTPVFYMNYNLYPQANPWRDAIGTAVKRLHGVEYTISRPRDLWSAWTDIVSRIIKQKNGTPVTALSSQN
jgi:hypothetical protein